jgi:FkbM family methyltransferase
MHKTHALKLAAIGRIVVNKAVYVLVRALAKAPPDGWLHSPWHWYHFPFSLRDQVLWSPSLQCWFCPVDESAIECMLRLPSYEPVVWVSPKPGDVFIDIGSYVGWYTIRAAKAVGANGRVIALEPDPINRHQLERNLSLNQIRNCAIVPVAAWSRPGQVRWRPGKEPVWHRVDDQEGLEVVESVKVDDLVAQLNLKRVDWIKMDIEGGEVEALRGALDTLRRFRPTLFIEIHSTLESLRTLLMGLGYAFESETFDQPCEKHGWILARAKGLAAQIGAGVQIVSE